MRRLLQVLLPLVALGGGLGVANLFVATGPQAAPVQAQPAQTFVRVQSVQRGEYRPSIRAMGIVQAERSVSLAPEVAGRVKEANADLLPGELLTKGEPILRVDGRDYSDALAMTQAELAAAQLRVREESTLRKVAEHEWRDAPEGFSDETLAFALREPHLDVAKAQVKSARTRIAKAKRDLGRTLLRAPFDAVVMSETVELGQSVSPAVPVVSLAATDRFRVEVSIPVAQLRELKIPGVNTDDPTGSTAKVYNEAASDNAVFEGTVVRLERAVDQRGRMAKVHIAVDDPMSLSTPADERPLPLLIRSSVRVELTGEPISGVSVLPRTALQENGQLWVVGPDDALQAREVEIRWRDANTVVVSSGVEPGERVVTTGLPLATEGMKVTVDEAAG
ncbi:MAG: efflux RND transporter periplasmic adaptor subunit [Nannocystaceae bacterium]|nr:efflux RND transporter periplasmic adaptor subunit [bacterium]